MNRLLAVLPLLAVMLGIGCGTACPRKAVVHAQCEAVINGAPHSLRISEIDGQSVNPDVKEFRVYSGSHLIKVVDDACFSPAARNSKRGVRPISMNVFIEPGKVFTLEALAADMQIMETVMSWK
jgi:hypothetical protein